MSLGKRQAEAAAENKLREEKKTCGCKWEYSGNFEILCDKHARNTPGVDDYYSEMAREMQGSV